jgi:tripeptidyl-peptidase I
LDTQYTVGVAGGVPVTFISVGPINNDGINGFLDIINFLLSQQTLPQVLTTSYGFNESGNSASIAKYDSALVLICEGQQCHISTLCNVYMQLGARGVSIFFSSGDGGVSGGNRRVARPLFQPSFQVVLS